MAGSAGDVSGPKAPQNASAADIDHVLEMADLRHLMGTPTFRRTMHRLRLRAGIFDTTHRPDARDTAFLEGRRALGLELMDRLESAVPGAFAAILSEFGNRQEDAPVERRHDPYRDLRDDD